MSRNEVLRLLRLGAEIGSKFPGDHCARGAALSEVMSCIEYDVYAAGLAREYGAEELTDAQLIKHAFRRASATQIVEVNQ